MNHQKVYGKIVAGAKKYFDESGFSKAVFGLSGGIDSTLIAYILADALGAKNVTALIMPENNLDVQEHAEDAQEIAAHLGINPIVQPIDEIVEKFRQLAWGQNQLAEMNLKARIRMILLYSFANSQKALVVGTSNRSELLLGYFTKHGDGATDILPLGAVYKTDLCEIAKWRKLPEKVICREPTAGLYEGQTDAKELGGSYAEIDPILKAYVDGKKSQKQLEKKFGANLVKSLVERIKANEHKRKMPFVVKIGK